MLSGTPSDLAAGQTDTMWVVESRAKVECSTPTGTVTANTSPLELRSRSPAGATERCGSSTRRRTGSAGSRQPRRARPDDPRSSPLGSVAGRHRTGGDRQRSLRRRPTGRSGRPAGRAPDHQLDLPRQRQAGRRALQRHWRVVGRFGQQARRALRGDAVTEWALPRLSGRRTSSRSPRTDRFGTRARPTSGSGASPRRPAPGSGWSHFFFFFF